MTPGFLKVPKIYFDSGIASAIGFCPLVVYLTIRRFERIESSFAPRIKELIERGYLIGYANQTKIALLLGVSRSSVTRAIQILKAAQWIKEVRLKDNGSRIHFRFQR